MLDDEMPPGAEQNARAERISATTSLPMLGALGLSLWLQNGMPVAIASALSLIYTGLGLTRHEHPRSYLPTLVTCLRACITCALLGWGHRLPGAAVALVVLSMLALDGVDGYLARRMRSTSVLGARLDMEADAVLVVAACLHLALRGIGTWVLTGAALRYTYALYVRWFSAHGEVPRAARFRYTFVLSLVGLTAGFLVDGELRKAGPGLATLLLGYSFAYSFYWSSRSSTLRRSQSNKTSDPRA